MELVKWDNENGVTLSLNQKEAEGVRCAIDRAERSEDASGSYVIDYNEDMNKNQTEIEVKLTLEVHHG